jgi:hypothetical protein
MGTKMKSLLIEASTSSPFVKFDLEAGYLEMGGESYPENSFEFYSPIIRWIEKFLSETKVDIIFSITLSYLNTSSTKYMIDILDRLEAAHRQGRAVKVEWYYDADNGRAGDTIEEFKEDFSMPFSVVPLEA